MAPNHQTKRSVLSLVRSFVLLVVLVSVVRTDPRPSFMFILIRAMLRSSKYIATAKKCSPLQGNHRQDDESLCYHHHQCLNCDNATWLELRLEKAQETMLLATNTTSTSHRILRLEDHPHSWMSYLLFPFEELYAVVCPQQTAPTSKSIRNRNGPRSLAEVYLDLSCLPSLHLL